MKKLSLVVAAVMILSATTFAKGKKHAPTANKAAVKTEQATASKDVKKSHTKKAAKTAPKEKAAK